MDATLNSTNNHVFPVAAIAAGPDGIEAVIKLVSVLPVDSEIAYVLTVQKDTTSYSGNVSDTISSYTTLPVSEIINTIAFIPNHIYVIPANSNLTVQDGLLKLYQQTRLDRADESIDLFFTSLTTVYKSAVIGIILSGSGFQGTEGFKRLKEIGAPTITQDPQTTTFREMPQHIINAGLADYVEVPELIANLVKKIARVFAQVEAYGEEGSYENEGKELISNILAVILLRTGNDFSHYSQYVIRRRIAHRMVSNNRENLHDYYAYVRHNKQEQDLLFNDLLITVTGFFTDAAFYDSLASDAFPHLVQNTVDNNLRIWIVGCASGQQAYSVAISLHECLKQTNNEQINVQIFATDLSETSILAARKGVYTEQDLQHVSESRRLNYFIKRNGAYHVGDVIRDMCIFATHNVVKNRPLSRIDLICCTNVLSFFDVFNQSLAFGAFHHALQEKGVLVLGTFESIICGQELFENFEGQENLYTPIAGQGQQVDRYPVMARYAFECYDKLVSTNDELLLLSNELRDRQKQLSDTANFAESIIQTIHEPVLLLDKNFIIKTANPAFYKYFKTAQKKTAGYSFFEIGNCQWNIAEFKAQIIKMQHDKTVIKNYRVETECEGIGKKIMNLSARPIDGGGPEDMYLIALQDITEANFANELFEAKNLELQKYNELLQSFAVAATNNIMDPLQKIQMLGKRIFDREINLSDSSRHNLQRILFSAQNVNKLIEDLILYSKISFLKKEYKKTDLNIIVKRNLNDLKNIIKEKKAVVKVAALPQLEVIPAQIQQLFTNIIFNAIQYSRDNLQPEIHIESQKPSVEEIIEIGANPETSFTKISITDNGIGFDMKYETQIFDPFFRLHTNDQYIGSGLGLTLVKKIVNSHRGYVMASSKIHEGTKINIYIPVHQES